MDVPISIFILQDPARDFSGHFSKKSSLIFSQYAFTSEEEPDEGTMSRQLPKPGLWQEPLASFEVLLVALLQAERLAAKTRQAIKNVEEIVPIFIVINLPVVYMCSWPIFERPEGRRESIRIAQKM